MEKAFNFGATTLFRAFNQGRTYPEQQQHKKDVKLAREKAQAFEQRPAQLPLERINISSSDLSLKDPQQSQPACILFQKLPPEIRARIWEEVLGRSVLRFEVVDKGVKHRRLPLPPGHRGQFSPDLHWNVGDGHYDQFPTVDVRVLRTCHAVYAECMPALWSSNTVAMSSPLVLLYLHDYILPASHFNQIRHLQFQWTYIANPEVMNGRYIADYDGETWQRFWKLVAEMGLQSLGANIGYLGPPNREGEIDADWTKPMLEVTGVRNVSFILEGLTRPSDGFQRKEQLEREIETRWGSEV